MFTIDKDECISRCLSCLGPSRVPTITRILGGNLIYFSSIRLVRSRARAVQLGLACDPTTRVTMG